MRIFKILSIGILAAITLNNSYAVNVVSKGSMRAVKQVHWQKETNINIQQILQQPVADNSARLIFLRPKDNGTLQSSANIAINNGFQVSLQSGNFSRVSSCVGVNQISGQITGNKNNDLMSNITTFKLESGITYFFLVDVDNDGSVNVRHITQESAMDMIDDMKYQAHQISRVLPNCHVAVESTLPPPVVKPEPPQYEDIQLNILFDNDKSVVKEQYYDEVKRVADFMKQHPEVTVTLEGHTDDNASTAYNVSLSQRRVDATKHILINQYDIAASRINAIGYGESKPIADNLSEKSRQKNRRVVAVFENNRLR